MTLSSWSIHLLLRERHCVLKEHSQLQHFYVTNFAGAGWLLILFQRPQILCCHQFWMELLLQHISQIGTLNPSPSWLLFASKYSFTSAKIAEHFVREKEMNPASTASSSALACEDSIFYTLIRPDSHFLATQYKMRNKYFSADFHNWPNTLSWGSVRIFLGGYLDSAFLTRIKFSIFKFSERFLEISCRDLTLYSLYWLYLLLWRFNQWSKLPK